MIIDAHQHFWRIDRGDYSWMDDSVAPIRRDILPADLSPLAEACGVSRTVLVQAAPTCEETLFMLSLADETPLIGAVIGWLDLTGDVEGQLARLAHPKLRGIRPMLQDIAETEWILRPEVLAGLRKVAAAGLRLDALALPRHLDALARLAEEIPELPIVIDHCAKPDFDGAEPDADWRAGMAVLAAHPQVCCKLSGLANEAGPGWTAETLRPVFEHVLAAFGPDRLMWGSDWPVLELAGDYRGWLEAAQELTASLGRADRDAIFGGTAARFYALDEGETEEARA
ncbi:amidohydrolase family protein [Pseudoroseicyclus tamaricis]|uniref:Amidohydrolase family protein n=1 Tax=Pseudoroseicyclus tamaricis TaxID=2705421 RepID=A0A6B2JV77_9RHOB|nr:amidohydrolase family protein [Pseudoroseicyclus tamaricis]NDV00084.1 amidohydrolase family protein [Pseudoroseicyclus tamaricis]